MFKVSLVSDAHVGLDFCLRQIKVTWPTAHAIDQAGNPLNAARESTQAISVYPDRSTCMSSLLTGAPVAAVHLHRDGHHLVVRGSDEARPVVERLARLPLWSNRVRCV